MRVRVLRFGAILGAAVSLTAAMAAPQAGASSNAMAVLRSPRLSGVVQLGARGSGPAAPSARTECTLPGNGNYLADCNSITRPVNETSIATNGSVFVAGANDYNSWNGNADLGFYRSTDARTWLDNGPLDLFPHGTNTAAGDPGLAIGSDNVVYYSSIYFDYGVCNVGGIELSRRDPSTGQWGNYEIRANTNNSFQDKPAIAYDGVHVFVSWDEYRGCFGSSGMSRTLVAVFDDGPVPTPPLAILQVPGTSNSAGSALAPDGAGGFYIALEDFTPFASSIELARYRPGVGWTGPVTISPPGFTDLPSPLPGFAFRNNSFPMLTTVNGQPKVVWTSYDSGVGRTYLWSNGNVSLVSNSGGDQFFPSIAATTSGQLAISWSQTNQAAQTYDQYLSQGGVSKVSNFASLPNQDCIFTGTFIGDYNQITTVGETAYPIWTQVTRNSTECAGKAQDALVYAP